MAIFMTCSLKNTLPACGQAGDVKRNGRHRVNTNISIKCEKHPTPKYQIQTELTLCRALQEGRIRKIVASFLQNESELNDVFFDSRPLTKMGKRKTG